MPRRSCPPEAVAFRVAILRSVELAPIGESRSRMVGLAIPDRVVVWRGVPPVVTPSAIGTARSMAMTTTASADPLSIPTDPSASARASSGPFPAAVLTMTPASDPSARWPARLSTGASAAAPKGAEGDGEDEDTATGEVARAVGVTSSRASLNGTPRGP